MNFEEFEYLTSEDILNIHQYGLERYDGLPGLDLGCVEAKVYLPQQGFGNHEKYPTILEKAAVYMYFLTIGHCFKDGNKRAGYLSASAFLNLNGYIVNVGDDELYDKCIEIANNETRPPFEDVAEWLSSRIEPYDYEEDPTLDL